MTPCDFLKCLFLFSLGSVCQSCSLTFSLIICLIIAFAVCKSSKPEVSRKSSPAHLHHPDSNKASFLNTIFQKLWPYLKHDLHTFLEELSVKLSNLSQLLDVKVYLETFPEKGPTITEVKISKISDSSKLIMDLNIEFFNTHPILTVMFMTRWKFLKCCFKLQRFDIKGTFRVLFNLRKGDSMLEISSIYISSIEIPSVYASFGNFSELIFIDLFISYLIDQFLEKNLVLPEKVLLFKDESSTDTEYKHQLPQGVLNIAILEARNLMNNDKFSPSPRDVSDPYVMMHIEVDSRTHIFQTHAVQITDVVSDQPQEANFLSIVDRIKTDITTLKTLSKSGTNASVNVNNEVNELINGTQNATFENEKILNGPKQASHSNKPESEASKSLDNPQVKISKELSSHLINLSSANISEQLRKSCSNIVAMNQDFSKEFLLKKLEELLKQESKQVSEDLERRREQLRETKTSHANDLRKITERHKNELTTLKKQQAIKLAKIENLYLDEIEDTRKEIELLENEQQNVKPQNQIINDCIR